jgi:hypothetical protein
MTNTSTLPPCATCTYARFACVGGSNCRAGRTKRHPARCKCKLVFGPHPASHIHRALYTAFSSTAHSAGRR